MRQKWRYVFSQVEDIETQQDQEVPDIQDEQRLPDDPNGMREKILSKLRSSPKQLQNNPAVLSAMDNCIAQIPSGSVGEIMGCMKVKTNQSGLTDIANAIEEFISGQAMSPLGTVEEWNKRKVTNPFKGYTDVKM